MTAAASAWRRYRREQRRCSALSTRAAELATEADSMRPHYSPERSRLTALADRCDALADHAALAADRWGRIAVARTSCERSRPFALDGSPRLEPAVSELDARTPADLRVFDRPPGLDPVVAAPSMTGPRTTAPPLDARPAMTYGDRIT